MLANDSASGGTSARPWKPAAVSRVLVAFDTPRSPPVTGVTKVRPRSSGLLIRKGRKTFLIERSGELRKGRLVIIELIVPDD